MTGRASRPSFVFSSLRLRNWLPAGEPLALVLAASIDEAPAVDLASQGYAVWTFADVRQVSIDSLACVALELRKRHPRLTLLTDAPPRLLKRFSQKYPPLTDGPLDHRPIAAS